MKESTMIFGDTPEKQKAIFWHKMETWERWFAWYPVNVGSYYWARYAWLETVERRGVFLDREYRLIGDESK